MVLPSLIVPPRLRSHRPPTIRVGTLCPGRERRSLRSQPQRSEEHTSELQSPCNLVCRLLLEKKTPLPSPASERSPTPVHAHMTSFPWCGRDRRHGSSPILSAPPSRVSSRSLALCSLAHRPR